MLTPRLDTEVLVEEVLLEAGKMQAGSSRFRILDMCTGSGCILLALLSVLKEAEGTGADLSGDALSVLRETAGSWGITAGLEEE